jgi:hypothetical protein
MSKLSQEQIRQNQEAILNNVNHDSEAQQVAMSKATHSVSNDGVTWRPAQEHEVHNPNLYHMKDGAFKAPMPQTVHTQVGFEKALNEYFPEWGTEWSQREIDKAAFFYKQGVNDTTFFSRVALLNMEEGRKAAADAVEQGAAFLSQSINIPTAKDGKSTAPEQVQAGVDNTSGNAN